MQVSGFEEFVSRRTSINLLNDHLSLTGFCLFLTLLLFLLTPLSLFAQQKISGKVLSSKGTPLEFANVLIKETNQGTITDSLGKFQLEVSGKGPFTLQISLLGYQNLVREFELPINELQFSLAPLDTQLDEVVVSGTLQEVSRLDSPVPVEVYKSSFFKSKKSLFITFKPLAWALSTST